MNNRKETSKKEVVLIGAGIMSATLSMMLKQLDPEIHIKVYEMLDEMADESSSAMNNAGTGHSGFCELNYTPELADGTIDISKAVYVASQFELSKEFWSYLVEHGYISSPDNFIHTTPHYSFVTGEKDINFLRKRYETIHKHPLFKQMEYSEEYSGIKNWIPLVMEGRSREEKNAATKIRLGTDVNFGSLTKEMFSTLIENGEIEMNLHHKVKDLTRREDGRWDIKVKNRDTEETFTTTADFVFIGAGGGAILLLEKSGIREARGFGGFPVGGEWLVCTNEAVIKRHHAKVYGQAGIGAPPMSVPHLDSRTIDGKQQLLFGPFAVFSTKFLKHGSFLDLFKSLRFENIGAMIQAGWHNMDLTKYLIDQVKLTKSQKIDSLKQYFPEAVSEDWEEKVAGQRVQVIEKDEKKGGVLKFGTEVISSEDGSLSALLGASPGASTAVAIMLDLLKECFSEEFNSPQWQAKLKEMVPSYAGNFNDEAYCDQVRQRTHTLLGLEL
ncbi:malate dehydrogenase (quinone) [Apibacter sp. HY039]|uniref:malate dehydrogenase (quinone) n=1 Tax=Apibacter sp. HY039 TaxID=2501476 RepID=UPI000FEBB104|nr:malate dehydrogenase (quinone) [Apibacter sp. HY039]